VIRPADRRLAATLWERGVSLEVIETAFLLATTRRNARPGDQPPLPPVRSLHYFLPIIDEVGAMPDPAVYARHLSATLGLRSEAEDPADSGGGPDRDPSGP
jgi:hypothetical protein